MELEVVRPWKIDARYVPTSLAAQKRALQTIFMRFQSDYFFKQKLDNIIGIPAHLRSNHDMWNFYIDFAKKHSKFTKNNENNDKTSKNHENREKIYIF